MPYSLKHLASRHHAILRDSVLGLSNTEIAIKYNMHPLTISCILRSPLARAEAARLRALAEKVQLVDNRPIDERLKERLEKAAEQALETNVHIMNSPLTDVKVKARVASHFLDKVIFKQQEDTEKETSYRDILRSVAGIEAQLRASTVIPVKDAKVIDSEEKAS